MPRQHRVDEGVGSVHQFHYRAVTLHQIGHEANRFLEHGLAQLVGERGKALAIDSLVRFEPAEIQPVPPELGGQPADARIAQQAPGLGQQHLPVVKIAGGRVPRKLAIRKTRPQKVAQPARELVMREQGGFRTGIGRGAAEEKAGRDQHTDKGIAHGLLVAQILRPPGAIERKQLVALVLGQGPLPGPGRQSEEGLQLTRLRFAFLVLQPPDPGRHPCKVFLDNRVDLLVDSCLPHLVQVEPGQPPHLGLRGDVGVLAGEGEFFGLQEGRRLPPLEVDEVGELPNRRAGQELQLVPHDVERPLILRFQDQFVEGRIVPEITEHHVKPGAEVPALVAFLRRQEHPATFRDVKGVGEDAAETRDGIAELRGLDRPVRFGQFPTPAQGRQVAVLAENHGLVAGMEPLHPCRDPGTQGVFPALGDDEFAQVFAGGADPGPQPVAIRPAPGNRNRVPASPQLRDRPGLVPAVGQDHPDRAEVPRTDPFRPGDLFR